MFSKPMLTFITKLITAVCQWQGVDSVTIEREAIPIVGKYSNLYLMIRLTDGRHFGYTFSETEVQYIQRHNWLIKSLQKGFDLLSHTPEPNF